MAARESQEPHRWTFKAPRGAVAFEAHPEDRVQLDLLVGRLVFPRPDDLPFPAARAAPSRGLLIAAFGYRPLQSPRQDQTTRGRSGETSRKPN